MSVTCSLDADSEYTELACNFVVDQKPVSQIVFNIEPLVINGLCLPPNTIVVSRFDNLSVREGGKKIKGVGLALLCGVIRKFNQVLSTMKYTKKVPYPHRQLGYVYLERESDEPGLKRYYSSVGFKDVEMFFQHKHKHCDNMSHKGMIISVKDLLKGCKKKNTFKLSLKDRNRKLMIT